MRTIGLFRLALWLVREGTYFKDEHHIIYILKLKEEGEPLTGLPLVVFRQTVS